MRVEDRVGERRLLPLLGVRRELLDREAADRLAQLLVLVGEDEVLAAGAEVGLEDAVGGGHERTVTAMPSKVNSGTSYFQPLACVWRAGAKADAQVSPT